VISEVGNPSIVVKTGDGKDVRIEVPDNSASFSLTRAASPTWISEPTSAQCGEDGRIQPDREGSAVWLHKGFELRIIDDELRALPLGTEVDLTPTSIIAHGWDDIGSVSSRSVGPTDTTKPT